jgi:peroxin-4
MKVHGGSLCFLNSANSRFGEPISNNLPGGRWLLDIHIPNAYPLSPPSIRFVTPICHPNVDFKTGEICLDLLKSSWTPAYTISTTMTSIHQLLTSAEPDSPLNVDVAQLFRIGDEIGAQSLIRFYTETERYNGRRR